MKFTKILILGCKGEDVLAVQIALNRYFGDNTLEENGVFSPETFGAVWKWKQEHSNDIKSLSGVINEDIFNKIVNKK